ncbi:uncharacterized protein LOC124174167 [Ischnura elegans]|uniref:uncharacterized protein LOC124174167 n=1 Tax=Ischnura elegans TaxID=197161 RepID=UPI001ED8A1AF|nr:uncharacterized protein LOC124174167 [Ischnura elegans]
MIRGRLFVALALAWAFASASPLAAPSVDPDDLVGSVRACFQSGGSLTSCVKGRLYSAVDRALDANEDGFSVVEGVQVVKTNDEEAPEEQPRSLDDSSIEDAVWSRVSRYLRTHTVKVDVKGSEVAESISNVGRTLGDVADSLGFGDDSVEESGRKKVKKLKILLPLLLLLKLKIAALIPLAIAAIALIAGKALLIGKLALVLAIVLGLKKLFSQEKVVTYEVVAHPHHSHSHSHGSVDDSYSAGGYSAGGAGGYSSSGSGTSGGWGRSFEVQGAAPVGWEPQDLAYRAHQPQPAAPSTQQ